MFPTFTTAPAQPETVVQWLWVDTRSACFGVAIADGMVVDGAELIQGYVGATVDELLAALAGATIVPLSVAS